MIDYSFLGIMAVWVLLFSPLAAYLAWFVHGLLCGFRHHRVAIQRLALLGALTVGTLSALLGFFLFVEVIEVSAGSAGLERNSALHYFVMRSTLIGTLGGAFLVTIANIVIKDTLRTQLANRTDSLFAVRRHGQISWQFISGHSVRRWSLIWAIAWFLILISRFSPTQPTQLWAYTTKPPLEASLLGNFLWQLGDAALWGALLGIVFGWLGQRRITPGLLGWGLVFGLLWSAMFIVFATAEETGLFAASIPLAFMYAVLHSVMLGITTGSLFSRCLNQISIQRSDQTSGKVLVYGAVFGLACVAGLEVFLNTTLWFEFHRLVLPFAIALKEFFGIFFNWVRNAVYGFRAIERFLLSSAWVGLAIGALCAWVGDRLGKSG